MHIVIVFLCGDTCAGVVLVGNRAFMEESHVVISEAGCWRLRACCADVVAQDIERHMFEYETDGKTAMCMAVDGKEVGAVAVADTLKVSCEGSSPRHAAGDGFDRRKQCPLLLL